MQRLRHASLFWHAFLMFWGAMALIVACGMLLTASLAWYRFASLDGLNPANLTRDASQVARTQGVAGLERWLRAMHNNYAALEIYVLDADGGDLLNRRVPSRLQQAAEDYRRLMNGLGLESAEHWDTVVPTQESMRISWWDPQPLSLPDGRALLMLFLPLEFSHWDALSSPPVLLALLLFALSITAPFCWLLMRHVTRPLDQLRDVAQALAQGRLGTRAPETLTKRKDELGRFARDFDAMAARLQSLVDTRELLLRNMAHELRSPLARLQLALELARRKDATQDTQFDRIEREGKRLEGLVGRTLDLARMGAMPPPTTPLELGELVDEVVRDACFEAGGRNIAIEWRERAPAVVLGNEASLSSAVENVLRNALRHAPTGSVISLSLRVQDHKAILEIADQGPGVPEADLPNLFEPFYRVAANSVNGTGAGLGLTIARAAVHAHAGAIHARNAKPQGLCVTITLPQA